MGEFSIMHLLILFGILILLFGGRKLPEVGEGLGRAIRGFKDGLSGKDEKERDVTRESLDATKKSETDAAAAAAAAKKKDTTNS